MNPDRIKTAVSCICDLTFSFYFLINLFILDRRSKRPLTLLSLALINTFQILPFYINQQHFSDKYLRCLNVIPFKRLL